MTYKGLGNCNLPLAGLLTKGTVQSATPEADIADRSATSTPSNSPILPTSEMWVEVPAPSNRQIQINTRASTTSSSDSGSVNTDRWDTYRSGFVNKFTYASINTLIAQVNT
ncbi:hypothetical protein BDW22DRAFT_1348461, partial [Trametopsis cervina]